MNVNTYEYINLEYLEMMADGDADMKKVMLEMLLDELPVEVQKMRDLTNSESWDELKSVSHKMKSTLSYVGNNDMTEANRDIETATKDLVDLKKVPELMDIVESRFHKVFPELKSEFENL